jgi:hypothetical protein
VANLDSQACYERGIMGIGDNGAIGKALLLLLLQSGKFKLLQL